MILIQAKTDKYHPFLKNRQIQVKVATYGAIFNRSYQGDENELMQSRNSSEEITAWPLELSITAPVNRLIPGGMVDAF
jgi:hypothetical protein